MEKVYENNNILFKILPCLLIAMYAVMCLYGSTVCATDVTVDDYTYTLPIEISNKKYVLIYKENYNVIIFASDDEFHYQANYNFNQGAIISNTTNNMKYLNVFSKNDLYKISDISFYSNTSCLNGAPVDKFDTITFCNFDLKDKDGNVVFQGASPELAGVTIPAIQSAEEIPQAIIKTMKVVIPVGLVILGIGLVIYLIKSVILRTQ